MRLCLLLAGIALLGIGGCIADGPTNPSFAVSLDQARQILQDDSAHPKALDRPLVVIGGFLDPGVAAPMLAHDFHQYTRDKRIISISLGSCFSFNQCRQRIIDAVDRAFPCPDLLATTEVDVVGFSMGGLAARYAACDPRPGDMPLQRLRIHRLFTISSPLRGAVAAADVPVILHPLQKPMRPESAFLQELNEREDTDALYPVYSYICLGDDEIGETNAAVPGQTPWWVSRPLLMNSHDWAFQDGRILADITQRLRGEKPLTTDPPARIPTGDF